MAQGEFKCVLIGDGAVGKMCMATTYVTGNFPPGYIPVVFENMSKDVSIDQGQVTVNFWITAGQEDYDRLRPMTYPETDLVMVCFALMSRSSMENVKDKWIPEIRHHCPHVPFMIVGTKLDLRTDEEEIQRLWQRCKQKPITTDEGRQLASSLGAVCYMECSAKSGENLKETMEQVARFALDPNRKQKEKSKKNCMIM